MALFFFFDLLGFLLSLEELIHLPNIPLDRACLNMTRRRSLWHHMIFLRLEHWARLDGGWYSVRQTLVSGTHGHLSLKHLLKSICWCFNCFCWFFLGFGVTFRLRRPDFIRFYRNLRLLLGWVCWVIRRRRRPNFAWLYYSRSFYDWLRLIIWWARRRPDSVRLALWYLNRLYSVLWGYIGRRRRPNFVRLDGWCFCFLFGTAFIGIVTDCLPTLPGSTWPNNTRGLDLSSLAVTIGFIDIGGWGDDRFRLCDGCWGCVFRGLWGWRIGAEAAGAGDALELCDSVLDAHGFVLGRHQWFVIKLWISNQEIWWTKGLSTRESSCMTQWWKRHGNTSYSMSKTGTYFTIGTSKLH